MLLCPRFIILILEHADCHQLQANNNNHEEFALVRVTPITTATIGITSSLLTPITTDGSSEVTPPMRENPYSVTADTIRNVCYCVAENISRELIFGKSQNH